MSRFRIPGLSFSWRRATGLSAAKGKLSRKIGIPLTESGREKKIGRAVEDMLEPGSSPPARGRAGCAVMVVVLFAGLFTVVFLTTHALAGF